ncbi:unnamed protein product [Symbiodinium pilosum]|uniref:Uncharacterized protein n=1 Tax=Symbiodinium pilosum TaxID=2952 RepID=A0A812NJA3_SYMPI|nr:unnamed protein product [Symbiodinium pilosum]
MEASASAFSARIGVDTVQLQALQDVLPNHAGGLFDEAVPTQTSQVSAHCRVSVHEGSLLLEATLASKVFSFLCLGGSWMLWANALDGVALTDCNQVRPYFGMIG